MELVRTRTQERGCERMFYGIYGIGVDTRKSNDERETKDHLEKDCRRRQSRRGGRAGTWPRWWHAIGVVGRTM